jgi:hypothetical protein
MRQRLGLTEAFRQTRAMNAVVRKGECAGAGSRPKRWFVTAVVGFVLWTGGCFCRPALSVAYAGSLYHCTGVDGEAVFSSSTAGYRGCKKIATFASTPTPGRASSQRASVLRVKGSVATTARSLAADGDEPTTFAHVYAAVESNARPLAEADIEHTSLAQVAASVETTTTLSRTATASAGSVTGGDRGSDPVAAQAWPSTPAAKRFDRFVYYKVVHTDGSRYYGNVLPVQQKGDQVTQHVDLIPTCIACNLHSPIHWGSTALNLTAYADVIRAASAEYGVDEAFLRAIIHAESAFNPRALSLKGAQGLMQLMPGTASDMGVMDAFDTSQNIRGGARYLGLLLRDFNGNEQLAAAAYNAGPGAVVRYNGVPPYAETQVYVERVGTLRKRYGAAIHPPLTSANGSG